MSSSVLYVNFLFGFFLVTRKMIYLSLMSRQLLSVICFPPSLYDRFRVKELIRTSFSR